MSRAMSESECVAHELVDEAGVLLVLGTPQRLDLVEGHDEAGS
jgi:hypothetical protein